MRLAVAAAVLALGLAARAADPSAEAGKSYRIEASATPSAPKAGAAGTLVIAIQPLQKAHVHPQAPLKVTLEGTPGLTLAKTQLGRKDVADPKAEAPRFEVPFTATAAGKQEAKAKVDFFICSDQWCVKQVRDVVVAVDVK
ncbi:MAG TPA: hypothetical protein VFP50_06775 [Anaeromyxobacteraceae bacterium]|nr:hypothetical protein [Anaeromyxobacteraceae bacterium]